MQAKACGPHMLRLRFTAILINSGEKSMIRKLLTLATLLVLATVTFATAESVFPYKYEETSLENGLKVIAIPVKNPGLISYFTIVRAGSRDEVEPGKSGFAHFFEHMMFRGTEKYPAEKYSQAV